MPSAQRLVDLGTRRGDRALATLGEELRDKRLAAGLSQLQVANAAHISRSTYTRIELGKMRSLPIRLAAQTAAVLGLDLSVRVYPGPNPLRDAAHADRLARVLAAVGPPLSFRVEVPLPTREGQRVEQRAWDAMILGVRQRTALEMEMRLRDAQALERRIELKRRDDPVDSVVLLLADTNWNRRVVRDNPSLFPGYGRLTFAMLSRLLREGHLPPSSVVFV